jgi:hypothetical protein
MWWLQLVGVVAFTVLLVTGFVSLRRGEVLGRRTTFVAILVAGVVLDVGGLVALVLTA